MYGHGANGGKPQSSKSVHVIVYVCGAIGVMIQDSPFKAVSDWT